MSSFQKYIALGNLTRDPEQKSTPTGKTVVNFGMAINEKRGQTEEVLFINCEAWDKTGEVVAKYVKKGDQLLVEGRWRQWEGKDGKKGVSVTVSGVTLVGSGRRSAAPSGQPSATPAPSTPAPSSTPPPPDEIPF